MKRSEMLKAQIQESRINGDVSAEHLEWLAGQYETALAYETAELAKGVQPYDVLQVLNGAPDPSWMDFSTLRSEDDISIARRLASGESVNGFVGTFRIVRKFPFAVLVGPSNS